MASNGSSSEQPATKVASQSLLDPHHKDPFEFDPTEPLVLFIVQAVIIISFCNIIGFFFKRIRQPKVISEVIGGIILGPTAMGRIPNFSHTIFPTSSIPFLSLVANIGLVLFLFIIGLEVDFKLFKQNWRSAAGIGFFGLAIPFGIGAAVAAGIYNRFVDASTVEFGHFLLFICVAFAITAFPVLCRILTELKLLQNPVGIATLAAGVANDVIGWILLALAVTLVNSGAGLTALYVMLVVAAWIVFLALVVRPVFIFLARRSGSFEKGPTPGITCLVLLMTFTSAWFTQVIGVHSIFGGFLIGVIMPHDGGFANKLVAKIEDLVTVFFLPLYFTLSGLSTDLTQLNDGALWGWTVCVLISAEVSKFVPCFLMARWGGMDWRESGAVGSLMACKGLVELIVLNIGLKAGVLNTKVFAMFVLMAVVTTFVTTPLTLLFYPESYHNRKRIEIAQQNGSKIFASQFPAHPTEKSSFLVVLSQLEHLPSVMSFVKLLQQPGKSAPAAIEEAGPSTIESEKQDGSVQANPSNASALLPQVSALRLLELSQRTSDVMKASDVVETQKHDPILKIFSTFALLNGIAVPNTNMSIVLEDEFVGEIVAETFRVSPQLVILPWYISSNGIPHMATTSVNPIEKMLSSRLQSSPQYANLVRAIFQRVECDVAVLVDSGFRFSSHEEKPGSAPLISDRKQHLLCVFVGGPDDRAALSLVMQLSHHSNVFASVLRVVRTADPTNEDDRQLVDQLKSTTGQNPETLLNQMTINNPLRQHPGDTLYGPTTPAGNLQSETADNLLWATAEEMATRSGKLAVETVETSLPLQTIISRANATAHGPELMVVTGRSRQGGESHASELSQYLKERAGDKLGEPVDLAHRLGIVASSDVRKSLGDVSSALVASQMEGRILVIQARSADFDHNKQRIDDLEKSE
ncbi:K(+)/H(+) antiporter [Puccinia graminis f. sp. tritici]|uniref:K(+)/H(+) antiporter n=1 Tax=Puccinia graminis f. sp. tritici TaxID=56615 RepID=A0A5B0M912_PUCGR|nr:K(+)/H(+) antiporter [Puccinia graminis f. sp. tritici]